MPSTVPHLLLDEDGAPISEAAFAAGVRWRPGDTIVLGAMQRYRVLERRDPAEPGGTVVVVVERR